MANVIAPLFLPCAAGVATRRRAALAFAWIVLSGPLLSRAEAATPLIGYLAFGKPGDPTDCADELRRGLADLGLREERDYRFEMRHALLLESGLHEAARALAAGKPAVMVSGGINPMLALRAASPGTPLVSVGSGGMIEAGLIESFAQPGGVLTGISNGEREHSLKALELLLQAFADPPRVGLVMNRNNPQHAASLTSLERLAAGRGSRSTTAWVDGNSGIAAAYAELRAQGVRHAVCLPDWVPSSRSHASAARQHGIATIGFKPNHALVGGLMSFSVRSRQGCQRAARHVQQILAGRKPAGLPVEQLDDYELVVNLGVLRQLGFSLAPEFIARADRVIE